MTKDVTRRVFGAGLLVGAGVMTVQRLRTSGLLHDPRKPVSRVAILHAESYASPLETILTEGLRMFHLDLRGKTVLLKPNLVEHIPGAEVNTNPLLVGAAADAFLGIGAKEVIVAEGPGHERDTCLVLSETGFDGNYGCAISNSWI